MNTYLFIFGFGTRFTDFRRTHQRVFQVRQQIIIL